MTSNKKIHILYWTLPILFILWEIFLEELPLVKDLLPQFVQDNINGVNCSIASTIAEAFIPFAFVCSFIWKYLYITVCYFLRSPPVVVLLTIFWIVVWVGVAYALYLPLERAGRSLESYQLGILWFFHAILTSCPFYLCVCFIIKRMCKLDLTNKSEKETISQGEIS